jgi:hypothetical protein
MDPMTCSAGRTGRPVVERGPVQVQAWATEPFGHRDALPRGAYECQQTASSTVGDAIVERAPSSLRVIVGVLASPHGRYPYT